MVIHKLMARVWKKFRGPFQWRVLWLLHSKYLIGVSGIVVDEQNMVLLLRHRYWTAAEWGLPSGYAKKGETLEEAIAREVLEETGYHIKDVTLRRVVSGYRLRIEATFEAKLAGGAKKVDPREIIEARFFHDGNLPTDLLRAHRELLTRRSDNSGRPSFNEGKLPSGES